MKKVVIIAIVMIVFQGQLIAGAETVNSINCSLGHLTSLIVGDWSGDGHEKTENIVICSNRSKKQLSEAYRAGTKIVRFDLSNDVARDYEDGRMPKQFLKQIRQHGLKVDLQDEEYSDSENFVYINADEFANLWMAIATIGDRELNYEIVQPASLEIGGYGLFY